MCLPSSELPLPNRFFAHPQTAQLNTASSVISYAHLYLPKQTDILAIEKSPVRRLLFFFSITQPSYVSKNTRYFSHVPVSRRPGGILHEQRESLLTNNIPQLEYVVLSPWNCTTKPLPS